MNGVRVTIASSARLPIVMKPLMNMNAAQTCRSWNRPSNVMSWNRSTMPLLTSGSNTCSGFLSFGSGVLLLIASLPPDSAIQSDYQSQKPGVNEKQGGRRDCGGDEDAGLAAK